MFGLKALSRFGLCSSKNPLIGRPMNRNFVSVRMDSSKFKNYLAKLYMGCYIASFAGLFTANTCYGIYEMTVIDKPYGDSRPLRNTAAGFLWGGSYGLIKGFTYSFGNVLFWLNACVEHHCSSIVRTDFGRMRECDIRFHFIPDARSIVDKITIGEEYKEKSNSTGRNMINMITTGEPYKEISDNIRKKIAKYLRNVGVLY